jgi:hypothetical protein
MAALFLFSGCDKFFKNDQKGPSPIVQFQATEFLCLKEVPNSLESYLRDEADVKTSRSMFICADRVLRVFSVLTTGENPNQFSGPELQLFLNRYLDLKNKISDEFMIQLMKVKVLLVGGSEEALTREEIGSLKASLKNLADVAVSLRGHWKFFLFTEDSKLVTQARIDSERLLMRSAIFKILDSAKISQSHYSWSDFSALVTSAAHFLTTRLQEGESTRESIFATSKVLDLLPLADHVRLLFLGESGDVGENGALADWKSNADWGLQAYALVANYHYMGLEHFSAKDPQNWIQALNLGDKVFALLKSAPQILKSGYLAQSALDLLIADLQPPLLSVAGWQKFYPQVTLSLLERSRKFNGPRIPFRGLELRDIEVIQYEYNVWKTVQRHLSEVALQGPSLNLEQQTLQYSLAPSSLPQEFATTWADWQKFVVRKYPLLMNFDLKLKIDKNLAQSYPSFESLTVTNGLRSLVRLIMMGYGNGAGDVSTYTITKCDLMNLSDDFADVLEALDLQKPQEYSLVERVFTDSRYFTFTGNSSVDISEVPLLEEVANLVSGGVTSVNIYLSKLTENQCVPWVQDSVEFYPVDCATQVLDSSFAEIFSGLRDLVTDVQGGRIKIQAIQKTLLAIAAGKPHKDGYLSKAELTNLSVVLYYLESLMTVYDTDHNQKISLDELKGAYRRFAPEIRKLSPLPEEEDKGAFLYVVYKGHIPQATSVLGLLASGSDYALFKLQMAFGLQDVTRADLLKVISLLKDQTQDKTNTQNSTSRRTSACTPISAPVSK